MCSIEEPQPGVITTKTVFYCHDSKERKKKLRGRSPQANYIDRATAVCRRS
jgi:hypothetical protein